MSLTLNLNINAKSSEKNDSDEPPCHLIPCRLHYNGQMSSLNYFVSNIRNDGADGENCFRCSFRGRPLLGEEVKLPEGYKGVVLEASPETNATPEEKKLNATNTFSNFTLWNLDQKPSDGDKCMQALDWAYISDAVHMRVK